MAQAVKNVNEAPLGAELSPARRQVMIGVYLVVVFLYWAALYLYVPTLSVYAEEKTHDLALVGVIISMYGLWQALVRLPLGIAADWLGWRKPFLIGGFILAGLGAWLMGVATDGNGLIIGRAITGLAAATWVPLVVVFSNLFPPEEAVRASAILSLVNALGRMVATGVTGSINTASGGYSMSFYLAAVLAFVTILAVLPAWEHRHAPKRPSLGGIGRLITRRDVLLPSLLSAVMQYAIQSSTFGFIPVLAKNLGATNEIQSVIMSMNLGVVMVGNLFATAIARRFGSQKLLYVSFGFVAAGLATAAMADSLWQVFVAQVLNGLAAGIGYPVMMGMSIERVDKTSRSTAMGLHQSVYAIGMFAGPWLSGILAKELGLQPMFWITAVSCLMLGIFGAYQLTAPEKREVEAAAK